MKEIYKPAAQERVPVSPENTKPGVSPEQQQAQRKNVVVEQITRLQDLTKKEFETENEIAKLETAGDDKLNNLLIDQMKQEKARLASRRQLKMHEIADYMKNVPGEEGDALMKMYQDSSNL